MRPSQPIRLYTFSCCHIFWESTKQWSSPILSEISKNPIMYTLYEPGFFQVSLNRFYMYILLASWVGKMNQVMQCCDWLPERARWYYFACLWLPAVSRKKNSLIRNKKSFIFQALSVNMAGYWPCSFLHFCWPQLFFIHKQATTNLANIIPALPHTWSITHNKSRFLHTCIHETRTLGRHLPPQVWPIYYSSQM